MHSRLLVLSVAALFAAGCHTSTTSSTPSTPTASPTTLLSGSSSSNTIYVFNGPNSPQNDGQQPKGTLVLVNGVLYGRTAAGGFVHGSDGGCGVFFSLNPDGTNYKVLYRFNQSGNGSDGCDPRHDAPVLFNNALYATNQGPSDNSKVSYGSGVIFSIPATPSPNPVTVVHPFAGAPNDGGEQHSSFSIDSTGLFYGQSAKGGANNAGQIYSLRGGVYQPFYDFSKTGPEGSEPHGRIVLFNGVLYGVTIKGGSGSGGTVFAIATPGPGPSPTPVVLHPFHGGPTDGYVTDHGYVTPTIDANGNTVLYGMTTCGGGATVPPPTSSPACSEKDPNLGSGIIYQITLAPGVQNPFFPVYVFTGGVDGGNPYGSLMLDPSGKTLYGTTARGGKDDKGIVFSIPVTPFGTAATPTTLLHFHGSSKASSGEKPIDNVILVPVGGTMMLCGLTVYGGSANAAADGSSKQGDGTVFCVPTTGSSS